MQSRAMARADFLTSIAFFVLGIYMIVEGWRLPGAGGFIEKGGEPGRVPILLGAIVAVFALILLVRSVSQQGHRFGRQSDEAKPDRTGTLRSVLTAAGCSFYAVGLLGATIFGWPVKYAYATGLFLFLFIVLAEWQSAAELGSRRWVSFSGRFPDFAARVDGWFGFIGPKKAPYVWLITTALIQAVLVTWAVTYLFEQEFYVKLP